MGAAARAPEAALESRDVFERPLAVGFGSPLRTPVRGLAGLCHTDAARTISEGFDDRCTVDALNALKREFDKHTISLKPWRTPQLSACRMAMMEMHHLDAHPHPSRLLCI